MLVSADVTPRLRSEVADLQRPCPEFLRLESAYGVRLLDWSALADRKGGHRSMTRSLRHVGVALRPVARAEAVLTDGEHLGIPLALAMRALGISAPHLMIGHHLTTTAKVPCFRVLHAERRIDRILVHSTRQLRLARRRLGLANGKVELVHYGVDTDFWAPQAVAEEPLIAAPGREHRDYRSLAEACATLPARVFVSDASLHNPGARRSAPINWPVSVQRGRVGYQELRQIYARAQVVVVPLIETDFPAGVTTVLEAMAMGKPTVVSATQGLAGVVLDGETGVLVPPGDPRALGSALRTLLESPAQRRRLGGNARDEAVARFSLRLYAGRLAQDLADLASHR